MISSIRGKILKLNLDSVQIETQFGLGFEILIPFSVHLALKDWNKKDEVFLYVYHSIQERGQKLFGFLNEEDKELFVLIKSMNGIGEQTALKILSFYNLSSLYQIATTENKELLEKIPKMKGKTSEKVMFELKQNIKKIESLYQKSQETHTIPIAKPQTIQSKNLENQEQKELAIKGLIQLGFSEKEAQKAVQQEWSHGLQDASAIIREVLKKL